MTDLIATEEALLDQMTTPSEEVTGAVSKLDGDILILGVGGKMGPSLAGSLVRAGARNVIGVSRFSDPHLKTDLEQKGIFTIQADLLDDDVLSQLPDAPYVLFLAGFKFGATGNESTTWAMNTWLPGRVLQRYAKASVVYVSSGNVYSYTSASSGGAVEHGALGPIGEYAQSRLGGERVAEYISHQQGTPLVIARLFYATELRYGILHDIAWKIALDEPIDLNMGYGNQIWQGDANAYLTRLFPLCSSPVSVINLTGPDVLSVRELAQLLGERMGKSPVFSGEEQESALLGDARRLVDRFGSPEISVAQMIDWVSHWVGINGRSLGKPTKYESRSGKF